jgi:type VI secretion system secreted protein Hcp
MVDKALGILFSKTALLLLIGIIILGLATSCADTASPTPGDVTPTTSATPGEATPTASVAVPVPGAEPFTGSALQLDMGAGYELFLKIDGMDGESTDDQHNDWIDVLSYSHRVSRPAAGAVSSGSVRSAERSEHEDFTIVKQLDKTSPKLALFCCNGAHIAEVRLEVCSTTGDKQTYMEYKMTDVIVSSVSVGGSVESGDARPREEVSFSYGKIEWTYTEFDATTGKAKGDVKAYWDLTANEGG